MTARNTNRTIANALASDDEPEITRVKVDAPQGWRPPLPAVAGIRRELRGALPDRDEATLDRLAQRARLHNGRLEVATSCGWQPITAPWALREAIELSASRSMLDAATDREVGEAVPYRNRGR